MSEISEEILLYLKDQGDAPVDSLRLADLFKVDHQKIVGAVKSLQSAGNVSLISVF